MLSAACPVSYASPYSGEVDCGVLVLLVTRPPLVEGLTVVISSQWCWQRVETITD